MNQCLYEAVHGFYPDCSEVCNDCCYFIRDEISEIISQWKTEAKVNEPILFRYDRERNKLTIYTTRPGYLIGLNGILFNKYRQLLLPRLRFRFAANADELKMIELIECNNYVM